MVNPESPKLHPKTSTQQNISPRKRRTRNFKDQEELFPRKGLKTKESYETIKKVSKFPYNKQKLATSRKGIGYRQKETIGDFFSPMNIVPEWTVKDTGPLNLYSSKKFLRHINTDNIEHLKNFKTMQSSKTNDLLEVKKKYAEIIDLKFGTYEEICKRILRQKEFIGDQKLLQPDFIAVQSYRSQHLIVKQLIIDTFLEKK